jgi:uncharacterized protein (DUF488 family)
MGHQLGARSLDRDCYVDDRVDYERIAATEAFQEGLRRIVCGASRHTIAIMCAEREPLDCHRTILVAQHLQARGLEIRHILADGTIEPHSVTEARLIARMCSRDSPDLFSADVNPIAQLKDAYSRRGREIAFRRFTGGSERVEHITA